MLTDGDIDLMNDWRDEMITKRRRPITLSYIEEQKDPLTGVPIGEVPIEREVLSVVTEISSIRYDGIERFLQGGIEVEKGDIQFSVKIELVEDIADKVTKVNYDENEYEVLAKDKKGIGRRNRFEFIGRLIS